MKKEKLLVFTPSISILFMAILYPSPLAILLSFLLFMSTLEWYCWSE